MIYALYVHVPFCVRRCRYCDFATAATRHGSGLMASYAEAVERQLDEAARLGLVGPDTQTAYIGGGTPTMLGASGLARLVGRVRAAAPALRELTFEANPESLGDDVLATVCNAGATRASIGVQSFNDRELAGLGRVHDAVLARDRVAAAVSSGLRVSIDLMCGIPYQTDASWRLSLETAVALGVGHVSCYPLMIEPGTPMERMCEAGELPWPSDDTEAGDMEAAKATLEAAGLARYEVASYAAPGARCLHNVAYWTGREYLGLGTSAASMLGREAYERLRDAVPSLPEAREDATRLRLTVTSHTAAVAKANALAALDFEVEQLTAPEAVAEDLMLAARMTDGIPSSLQFRAVDVIGGNMVRPTFDDLVSKGLLVRDGDGTLRPSQSGWLLGNELYGPLWDLASNE